MGHNLTFGDVSTSDFDVYISGEGLFNAPKKDVEKIDIPGRNGALLIDNDRFENIEVTYPAHFYKPGLYDFIANLSALRAAFMSKKGYQRLEDSFHPDEFRMGAFIGGLEVDPVKYNTAAIFDMIFDCKPQRYLKSGEVEQDLTGGGTILNPTCFKSAPLLKVEGRGAIKFNGYEVDINTDPLGMLLLFNPVSGSEAAHADFGNVAYISGDSVYVKNSRWIVVVQSQGGAITNSTPTGTGLTTTGIVLSDNTRLRFSAILPSATFIAGTAETKSFTANCALIIADSSYNCGMNISLIYDGDKTISTTVAVSISDPILNVTSISTTVGEGTIDSSATSLNEILYIDCEIGEAYADNMDYNNAVAFPNDLPVLSPGENTIEAANTITSLKIIPRWWRI